MLAAVGALVEMQGIVRMMNGLCSGLVFEQRGKTGVIKQLDGGPWKQKNMATTWWMATPAPCSPSKPPSGTKIPIRTRKPGDARRSDNSSNYYRPSNSDNGNQITPRSSSSNSSSKLTSEVAERLADEVCQLVMANAFNLDLFTTTNFRRLFFALFGLHGC